MIRSTVDASPDATQGILDVFEIAYRVIQYHSSPSAQQIHLCEQCVTEASEGANDSGEAGATIKNALFVFLGKVLCLSAAGGAPPSRNRERVESQKGILSGLFGNSNNESSCGRYTHGHGLNALRMTRGSHERVPARTYLFAVQAKCAKAFNAGAANVNLSSPACVPSMEILLFSRVFIHAQLL